GEICKKVINTSSETVFARKYMLKKTKLLNLLRKGEGDTMGNKSKHKTKRILVATATLTIIASGMASSSDVFAE
ncbi:hypothetical protein, partial [Bacillus nitratireducens]|uniref:hypothetical protein n=1 Tax=Bacillus nitratireducens TaxID=2026193 RepID=UPI0028470452